MSLFVIELIILSTLFIFKCTCSLNEIVSFFTFICFSIFLHSFGITSFNRLNCIVSHFILYLVSISLDVRNRPCSFTMSWIKLILFSCQVFQFNSLFLSFIFLFNHSDSLLMSIGVVLFCVRSFNSNQYCKTCQ